MNNIASLLKTYKLDDPVPEHIRKRFAKDKRKSLIKIYKKLGKYSPLMGLILFVFFFFRGLGIKLTMLQSIVILISTSVVSMGVVTGGIYITVKHIKEKESNKTVIEEPLSRINIESKEDNKIVNKADNFLKNKPVPVKPKIFNFKSKILINLLTSESIDKNVLKNINIILRDELVKLRGKDNIIFTKSISSAKSGYNVYGSVDKYKKRYLITAKVLDKKTGKILFASSVEAKSKNSFRPVCRKIASEVSKYIK